MSAIADRLASPDDPLDQCFKEIITDIEGFKYMAQQGRDNCPAGPLKDSLGIQADVWTIVSAIVMKHVRVAMAKAVMVERGEQ